MTSTREQLEQALAQAVQDSKIPHAIVYATNRDGSFTYSFATGLQKYGVDDEPIREDAVLMLASQTKLLTSIAVLQAVEQGLIGLDDDVSPHLPELGALGILSGFDSDDKPVLEARKTRITLRHLVTHTSGAHYNWSPDSTKHQRQRGQGGPEQDLAGTIVQRFDLALSSEAGDSWSYSPGLDWAGLVLQRVSGATLEDLMQKNIFAPLSLTGMTFWPQRHAGLHDRIPQLTVRTPDGALAPFTGPYLNTHSTDCFGGHGCYARLGDYIRVLRSLLANDGKLLTPQSVDMLFTPQLSAGSRTALNDFRSAFGHMVPGEFRADVPWDHGLGGALLMAADDRGGRKAGTLFWGGATNPFWMIDREAGLAFTFGTQVLPPGDPACKEMTGIAERAVYKMAGVDL